MRGARFGFVLACAAYAYACSVDTAPSGLRATPPGTGPVVTFDLLHRPLPEIPIPNDVATFADPTSRTGRRINASLVAPTNIERTARGAFDEMEGWGTSAPITVQFQRRPADPPNDSVIDLEDVRARMGGHEYDLSNDPVYLVNLTTGVPVILDMGNGNFPVTIRDLDRFWPNDPHIDSQNLLFETHEEGKGLTQADYRPELDMDFDGVLDHPNTLGPASAPEYDGVENLLTWYERETDTLILRPLLPMTEKTEYAVVLTDRLHGRDGQPVRSPFPYVHHPSQRSGVARLQAILGDAGKAGYFGDLAGTGLDHVAFAWTFTTQPLQEDMKLLRDGLYGKGPFAYFADRYPPKVTLYRAAGLALNESDEPPNAVALNPACATRQKTPYVVKPNDADVADGIHTYYTQVVGTSAGETQSVTLANQHIDHIGIGTFDSPYLQGDPANTNPQEARFHVDFRTGQGDVQTDKVHFWVIVPKATATRKPPFDVTFWQHGVTGNDSETMIYAGELAKQGIATIGIDMPEHGLFYEEGDRATAQTALRPVCLVEWVTATAGGRDRDYDDSGKGKSGWFWWTSHVFHVRDNVRQGLLDMMNTVRILKSFDGARKADQDYNGNGQLDDLAGDFDGDGVVDVGGPNAKYFSAGESLGGMMTEGIGGVEPALTATAPMSGGAGMSDIGVRSYGVTEAVWEQIMGPLVTSTPASDHAPDSKGNKKTQCQGDQRSVRMHLNDGDDNVDVEIACLNKNEDDLGMTVVLTNVTNKERRCARTGKDGRFRVPIPASIGDALDVQIYNAPDVVDAYGKSCVVRADAPIGRRITTFEVAATAYASVGDPDKSCTADSGCAQFRDNFYPVGSPLIAPNEGYGDMRNTPELRRLFQLVQAALDPADNFNYAPYYMLRPLVDESGNVAPPRALLSINTVGDMFVPVSTGSAFARAAGALPFLPPSALAKMPEYADYVTPTEIYRALGGKTPNQVLIENHYIEGVARLQWTHAGPSCAADWKPLQDVCPAAGKSPPGPPACDRALWDPDFLSEGHELYDQPHAAVPLRMARFADAHPTDTSSLSATWQPRILGAPGAADGAFTPSRKIVAQMHAYIKPEGQHTWDIGDVCRAWDWAAYGDAVIARFFASGGTDIYYLTHPASHSTCLLDASCDVFQ